MKLEYKPYTLDFKFDAGTSRGIMRKRKIWLLKISDNHGGAIGLGEVAPLWRLSVETEEEVELQLSKLEGLIQEIDPPSNNTEAFDLAKKVSGNIASIRMGLEMALLDLIGGGYQRWFDNNFTKGIEQIPINGLIWMGDHADMKRQAEEKLQAGFKCIKMKIGAIDFDKELEVLTYVRELLPDVELRVDANGAFSNNEVLKKLNKLADFNLHSIEQPILPRQPEAMNLLCQKAIVPVALDEELIGVNSTGDKIELLEYISPQYIVLKPSLLGGFKETTEWIHLAEERNVGWWITSALESNLGLYAIAQFASEFTLKGYQGLGTGALYHNNLKENTTIEDGFLKKIG